MEEKNKPNLKKNIILSFSIQLVCYLSPLIVSPYLTRILGAENIGIYSFSYSYANYFMLFASFGFINYGTKRISEIRYDFEKRNEMFWNLIFTRLVLVFIGIVVYLVFLYGGLFASIEDINIMLVFLILLFSVAFDITFFFRGIEKYNIISYVTFFVNILYVIGVFLFVRSGSDLLLFTFIKTITTSCLSFFLWFCIFGRISKPCIDLNRCLEIFKGSFAFFLPSLVMGVSSVLDQTLIGLFSTKVQVGFYQQSSKITTLLSAVMYAIANVALSRISLLNTEEDNLDTIKSLITKLLILSFVLLGPIIVGSYVIGNKFIPLYFGHEFEPAVIVFYFLLPIAFLSSLSSILISSYFYPKNKTTIVTVITAIAILINVSFTILLLKTTGLGASAAAIASIISELFIFVTLFIVSKSFINIRHLLFESFKICICLCIMFIVLFVVNLFVLDKIVDSQLLFILIDVLIGAIVYFVLLLLVREEIFISFANTAIRKINNKNN